MSQRDDPHWRQAMRSFGLVGYLGFAIAVPIAGGAWLGYLVDRKLGTSGIVAILGILAGVAAGALSAYTVIMRALADDQPQRKDTNHGTEGNDRRDN